MDSDLTIRIKKVAQEYGLTSTAFADQVEVPRPVISHIFSGRNRASLEVMQKVGIAFPEVDLGWLVYGKGQMLKKVAKEVPPEEDIVVAASEKLLPEIKVERLGAGLVSEPPKPDQTGKLPEVNSKREVRKIVYFYEDNSFEEFWPQRNR